MCKAFLPKIKFCVMAYGAWATPTITMEPLAKRATGKGEICHRMMPVYPIIPDFKTRPFMLAL